MQKVIDNKMEVGMEFEGSWIDFFKILGPSWEVNSDQDGTKIRKNEIPKRYQKKMLKK